MNMSFEDIAAAVIGSALARMKESGAVPADFNPQIIIERPKNEGFGDFGCAIPMVMCKTLRRPPAACGQALMEALEPPPGVFEDISFAAPGYINFKVSPAAWFERLVRLDCIPDVGHGEKVLLEFVSANPTGPLHAGHARGAVLGDITARLMRVSGYDVTTEYLLNDVGNQMAMLGLSMYIRGRQALELATDDDFPENGYRGDYIRNLAAEFVQTEEGRRVCQGSYEDAGARDDNPAVWYAADRLTDEIKRTLSCLDISFDNWFSERSLHKSGQVAGLVTRLLESDAAYRNEDGAVLFRMESDDDGEDRVVVRSNGVPTYFAADIAYHDDKARRGFARLINIWGADHHGYIPRVRAALDACGHSPDMLDVILVQMVTLTRNGEVVPMGKRLGRFVTLQDLVDEVGADAVRFIYIMRRADAQMEFDLELAKQKSMDNPVYYVQYGHARVASIIRRAAAEGFQVPEFDPGLLNSLTLPEERAIIRDLCRFPSVVASSAAKCEPHHVAFFLMELCRGFHSYYTKYKSSERVISTDRNKTMARLYLVSRMKFVLGFGLGLLGVSAPDEMHYEDPDGE
ncbi:arginine--tRNA ligase [Myxococcota bacterium]|nr:arginine--tRNA ligase [Myxococcota bacterium]